DDRRRRDHVRSAAISAGARRRREAGTEAGDRASRAGGERREGRAVMQVEAHAKINWALRVTGRRSDGFHDLETLFQEISLHDTLTIEPAERFAFTCDDPTIPTDERNLVVRAARALHTPPVAIHLQKRIP